MNPKECYVKGREVLFTIPVSENTEMCIIEYLQFLKTKNITYAAQRNHVDSLTFFFRFLAKNDKEPYDIDTLSKKDIYFFLEELDDYTYLSPAKKTKGYAEASKQKHRLLIKSFLSKLGRNDLSDLIEIKRIANTKLPEDLLTKEEVDKLINSAKHPRDKAFIAVIYESGARVGEMLSCNLKNIKFDENGCVLTFPQGKTGARTVRVVNAASYLRIWCDSHPQQSDEDGEIPLWPALRGPAKRIEIGGISRMIKDIAKKAGITKKVNPHNFRHTRATHLAGHLTEQQMKTYLGWTKDSPMASVYVHLSGKDMDDAVLKMYGLKTEETHEMLRPGRCPRCKTVNAEGSVYCHICGLPLLEGGREKHEAAEARIQMHVMDLLSEEPEMYEILKQLIDAEVRKRMA
jgi:integrase/recombinase XerD